MVVALMQLSKCALGLVQRVSHSILGMRRCSSRRARGSGSGSSSIREAADTGEIR
jgi:hypothetical protein